MLFLRQSSAAAAILIATGLIAAPHDAPAREERGIPILVYHRFGPAVADAMTVRTSTFRRQLEFLSAHDYHVVRLGTVVSYFRGTAPAPPPRSVVITVDDGHKSVFTDMLPLVREYGIPVTLFLYPSAISRASYALTWAQLETLHRTGLFDVQSHTYWHPNFAVERRRLTSAAYQAFVTMQLVKPKAVLQDELGVQTDLLAWPFGIHDDQLMAMASAAGYRAGFTIERRTARRSDRPMALPRFLVTDADGDRAFASMLRDEGR